jgi:hypothetical protein
VYNCVILGACNNVTLRGFRHPKSSLENAAESLLPANHSILLKAVLQLRDSPIRSSPPSSGACDNVTLRDFATQILARNAADFLFPGQSILPKVGVQILPFVALLVGRAQVCRCHRCAALTCAKVTLRNFATPNPHQKCDFQLNASTLSRRTYQMGSIR